jgi:hypothetical protein
MYKYDLPPCYETHAKSHHQICEIDLKPNNNNFMVLEAVKESKKYILLTSAIEIREQT